MTVDLDQSIGRRLKLGDLQILSGVVQQGSMAKAAANLRMSQPAVSEAIANLEAALGVRRGLRIVAAIRAVRDAAHFVEGRHTTGCGCFGCRHLRLRGLSVAR